jgi:hypothetical protein
MWHLKTNLYPEEHCGHFLESDDPHYLKYVDVEGGQHYLQLGQYRGHGSPQDERIPHCGTHSITS